MHYMQTWHICLFLLYVKHCEMWTTVATVQQNYLNLYLKLYNTTL